MREVLRTPGFSPAYGAGFSVTTCQWMQNVVLVGFAYELTRSASFVGLVALAQLGPTFALGLVVGVLADRVPRRTLLLSATSLQLVCTVSLVVITATSRPSTVLLVIGAVGCGLGQAIFVPTFVALLPTLVERSALPTAIGLNSTQLSLGRVVGPALGGGIYAVAGPAWAFATTAVVYAVVLLALVRVQAGRRAASTEPLRAALATGFRVVREDPVVQRTLLTITTFSLACLPLLNQMPSLAAELGIDPRDSGYGLLFVVFGLGAVLGGSSALVILRRTGAILLARVGLVAYGVLLGLLAAVHDPWLAYPVLLGLGLAYFCVFTAISTRLQGRLSEAVRGRVMSLWVMGFGGTIPIGAALAGPVVEHASLALVLGVGAVIALALAYSAGRPVADERGLRS